MASLGRLWPSPEYTRQVERLRAAVGETIYLVEIAVTVADACPGASCRIVAVASNEPDNGTGDGDT